MQRRVSGVLSALAAAAVAIPVTAQAPSPSPVEIDAWHPIINQPAPSVSPTPYLGGLQLAGTSSGMAITFVNNAPKTADLVNFAVDSNGARCIIRDVGKFSPGVQIVHTYRNGSGQAFVLPQFIAPQARCHVASVRFTDGTIWRPGQPASPIEPAPGAAPLSTGVLSVFPPKLRLDPGTESELFFVSSRRRVAAFKETDDCAGIAGIFVAATGESQATYSVKPVAPGSCVAQITDEDGNSVRYPIVVR